jgi:hypothetical protein
MSIVPDKAIDKVSFYENHATPWNSHAVQIGTSVVKVAAMSALAVSARSAYNAQQSAQQQAKAATQNFKDAVAALATAGSDIIKEIKTRAATGGNSIYTLAEIPVPATPTPVPPPGMPTAFGAILKPNGALELRWKCANPPGSTGTFYQVGRRVGATGEFKIIGGSGNKKFIDDTVPAGVAGVTYEIVAIRSTSIGTADRFTVSFGVGGAGEATALVAQAGGAPKLAA